MSQQDLAEVSGVAQPNVSAIENGQRVPTAETFQRLIEGCGFNVVVRTGARDLILRSPGDEAPAMPPEPPTITPHTPMAERVRALTAALDASEAIVRARR